MKFTFFAGFIELDVDGCTVEAGIPIEFTDVVVCFRVAAADWPVDLRTDCVAYTLRFWLIFRVTVFAKDTPDSCTIGSYINKSTLAEQQTRHLEVLLKVLIWRHQNYLVTYCKLK